MDLLVAVIGALTIALVTELQRAMFRDTYLDIYELLRGLGRAPSWRAIIFRVLLVPAAIGLVVPLTRVANPLLVGFMAAFLGNALSVWGGFVQPPPGVHRRVSAYRLLIVGFLVTTGLSGLVGGWVTATFVCSTTSCNVPGSLSWLVVAIIVGVITNILSVPLIRALYGQRTS